MKPAVYIACLLVGAFRPVLLFVDFNPHVDMSYQAAAHFLVATLLCVAYRNVWPGWGWLVKDLLTGFLEVLDEPYSRHLVWASVLTWIELICTGVKVSGVLG